MAALDFPASPANGQQFTGAGGIVWMWDGAKWVTQGVGGTLYLPLAGGQLTGPVGATPGSPPNAALFFGSGNTNTGLYGNATLVGILSQGQARFTVDNTAAFLTLPLTLGAGAPTAPTHAATKAYVDGFLPLAGGDLTGQLAVRPVSGNALMVVDKPVANQTCGFFGATAGKARWQIELGNGIAESGSNAGSNFVISRYNDAGASIDAPLSISRANGGITLTGAVLTLNGGVLEVLGAGTSFTQYSTQVKFGYHGVSAYGIGFQPTANDGNAMVFNNAAKTMVGNIFNSATATLYGTSSDGERKEDLKSFDAGNIIDATNVYDFKWKDLDERAYGVIAQQAIEVYPLAVAHSVVAETDEHAAFEYWGVDYSKYVPVMLQELKTLRERVATLEGGAGVTPA